MTCTIHLWQDGMCCCASQLQTVFKAHDLMFKELYPHSLGTLALSGNLLRWDTSTGKMSSTSTGQGAVRRIHFAPAAAEQLGVAASPAAAVRVSALFANGTFGVWELDAKKQLQPVRTWFPIHSVPSPATHALQALPANRLIAPLSRHKWLCIPMHCHLNLCS